MAGRHRQRHQQLRADADARPRPQLRRALGEAQALGYAEADPTLDVDGGDAAHKLSLLAAMAFGGAPRFHDVHVEGIRTLQA
jgi:homoserine dehydrogenase